eukprot:TRINITY_DN855_c0_g1_i4.p3 TRINITY_DN855_c0_g1~~TRINITY_DN855_c0_g1_i4.p3  ORF type:complete len:53 (+),score=11.98 TRINITY_DN855_c0_g1_i4:377-535(+)
MWGQFKKNPKAPWEEQELDTVEIQTSQSLLCTNLSFLGTTPTNKIVKHLKCS